MTWILIGNIKGATGPQGDSTQWLNGAGAPSNSLGDNGDYYLDELTGNVYSKASGSWSLQTNIKGPQGPAGSVDLNKLQFLVDVGPMENYMTPYREILPATDPFPTSVIWYDDNTKTKKVLQKILTYTGVNPTTIVWTIYQPDGVTPLKIATDTITYSGPFELSRERVVS